MNKHQRTPGLCMNEGDFGELYSFLELFNRVYVGYEAEVETLLNGIREIYKSEYPQDVSLKRLSNPRQAGRPPKYSDNDLERVRELRRKGMSIRSIAKDTGIPISTVGVILTPRR